ncbi:MAG: hypothetical protein LBO67_07370 [Spirochaetaceae bacterium]|jgi:tetratricopeptide (TPR) repeat protein|nr:hypothetical protein [Spirochaetaceae bacterium]
MFVLVVLLLITAPAFTQETGDSAIAARYVQWAQRAFQNGQYKQAVSALERALDFADTSSDISYLYALALSQQDTPQGAVLKAVRQALETGRWNQYTQEQARLLEIQVLIRLRLFTQALQTLHQMPLNADTSYLRLLSLKQIALPEFKAFLGESLDRYPRDARFVRLFLEYACEHTPEPTDAALLSALSMKIPLLLKSEPALAYLITPFIKDTDSARQFIRAYRQDNQADTASLPITLNLGVLDDAQIIQELAGTDSIERTVLEAVWNGLRNDEARSIMQERFARFSGTITEDPDKDGYPNFTTVYSAGKIISIRDDFNQDGLADQVILFEAGLPHHAELIFAPEQSDTKENADPVFAVPVHDAERQKISVQWEEYPALVEAEVQETHYFLRPLELSFAPVYMQEEVTGLVYPQRNGVLQLSTRVLSAAALVIERKSAEFDGARERIEVDYGIPQRAYEYTSAQILSETSFDQGKALSQKVDLNRDGYFETIRFLRLVSEGALSQVVIESFVTDWDSNGIFEGREFWKTK